MPQPSYAYAVARIRALENSLIIAEKVERMVEAQTATDALKVLADTVYGAHLSAMDSEQEYETVLKEDLKRTAVLIRDISPNNGITDLFLLKYDFHNLKVLFKAKILGSDAGDLLTEGGTIPVETLKSCVTNGNYISLPAFLKSAAEEVESLISVKPDPQKINLKLDKAMYAHIFSECDRLGNGFVKGYFIRLIDLTNIKSLVRVKKMGESMDLLKEVSIPGGTYAFSFYAKALDDPYERIIETLAYSRYGDCIDAGINEFLKTGSLALFEKLADDHLNDYIKANKRNPFGIEPIVGYLSAKENEARLIRTIMVGKTNNIPNSVIRERLRDLYV